MEQLTLDAVLGLIDHTFSYTYFILLLSVSCIALVLFLNKIFCKVADATGFIIGVVGYFMFLHATPVDLGGIIDVVLPLSFGVYSALCFGVIGGVYSISSKK